MIPFKICDAQLRIEYVMGVVYRRCQNEIAIGMDGFRYHRKDYVQLYHSIQRTAVMYKGQLHWKPIAALLLLALVWGANMAVIKIGNQEIAPLFMAGLRSAVASVCLYIWMKAKGIVLFPSKIVVLHGVAVGLIFGVEFGLIYVGLEYTLTSRVYILLYTAPFFAALQAHFFLDKDRLNLWKAIGLLLAFGGVATLFAKNFGTLSLATLPGDLMILAAGALWASTTVYIKRYLAHRTVSLQTLFYQLLCFTFCLFFSISSYSISPMNKNIFYRMMHRISKFYRSTICNLQNVLV